MTAPTDTNPLREAVEKIDHLLNREKNDAGYQAFVYIRKIWPQLKAAALASEPVAGTVEEVPSGATHMRRPEYLSAWFCESGASIPAWLVEGYGDQPLPEHRLGHFALAIDGEFWRWMDADKFNEMYCSVSPQGRGVGEPAVWRGRRNASDQWVYFDHNPGGSEEGREIQPLYATPPAPGAADRAAVIEWQPIETVPKDQEVEVRGLWKLRGDGVVFTHWRAPANTGETGA